MLVKEGSDALTCPSLRESSLNVYIISAIVAAEENFQDIKMLVKAALESPRSIGSLEVKVSLITADKRSKTCILHQGLRISTLRSYEHEHIARKYPMIKGNYKISIHKGIKKTPD